MLLKNMFLNTKCCVIIIFALVFNMNAKPRQKIQKLEDCNLPEDKYDKLHYVTHEWEIIHDKHGWATIKANFTITSKTPPVYHNVRGYKVRNEQRRLDFSITNVTCRNPVIEIILKKIKVKYVEENCVGLPGNYTVPKINEADLAKVYKFTILGIGLYIFEVEMLTEFGVIMCLSLTLDIVK